MNIKLMLYYFIIPVFKLLINPFLITLLFSFKLNLFDYLIT